MKRIGIEFIDFTGGEPTLAAGFVTIVSDAASSLGISCGIVTAAHWASTDANASKFLHKFGCIDNWDISTDVYHLPFVPLTWVRRAWDLLCEAGRPPLIRIAYNEPLTYEDAVLIDQVRQFAGRRIGFQPVGPVGRATERFQYIRVSESDSDFGPCPSTGPLVQHDGIVAPCCAPLSHETFDHPLRLGNAFTEPLSEIVQRWRVHPLLQTLRIWGFAPVLAWFKEEGLRDEHILRHRVCHECVELVRDPDLCRAAMNRASDIFHRIKLAYALIKEFDEFWLDNALRTEACQHLDA